MTTAFFFLFAGFVVAAALMVVLGRNLVHSAIALIFTFFGMAALYVLLDAEFLAAVQVLLYIGGITILLLFAIMLTSRLSPRGMEIFNEQVIPGALVSGGILAVLLYAAWQGIRPAPPAPPFPDTTNALGRMFLTSHVLPFEVASVLLLVAMVGAILLARKDR